MVVSKLLIASVAGAGAAAAAAAAAGGKWPLFFCVIHLTFQQPVACLQAWWHAKRLSKVIWLIFGSSDTGLLSVSA